MPNLILPKRFHPDFSTPGRIPIGNIQLDRDDPLSAQLLTAIDFTKPRPKQLVGFPTIIDSTYLIEHPGGNSASYMPLSNVNYVRFPVAFDWSAAESFSITFRASLDAGANANSNYLMGMYGTTGGYIRLQEGSQIRVSNKGGSVKNYTSFSSFSDLKTYTLVNDAEADEQFIYSGGVKQTNVGAFDFNMEVIGHGGLTTWAGWAINGLVSFVFIHDRALSLAEIKLLHSDPFRIAKPAVPMVYSVPSAVGGGRTIAVDQSETGDTTAATLDLIISLTGSVNETGDSQTATISAEVSREITASQSEAGDTTAATLEVLRELTATVNEAGDTTTANIQADFGDRTLTVSQSEAADTTAASLANIRALSAALAEAGDVTAVNLQVLRELTASQTEQGDSQAALMGAFDFIADGLTFYVNRDQREFYVLRDAREFYVNPE